MNDLTNDSVIHIRKENCEYLQFRKLLEYDDFLKHAYGLKPANYQVKCDDDIDNATNEYKKLCNNINLDYNNLIRPNQTHTDVVKSVIDYENGISFDAEKYKDTDGLITNKTGITLATKNADCILLLFFDPVKRVIANVHSGWRGTFKKIALNTVDKFVNEYGSNPEDIICCICPSIRKCHFEVEKDVKDLCEKAFSYTNRIDEFIEYAGKKDGVDKWMIDTVLINKIMLQDAGLLPENIVDSGICSVCNCEYVHSYRVEKKGVGLSSAVIGILP